MALDLEKLEEVGVFKTLEFWLEANLKHNLFNNDQHAWNLAATLHWQDLQQSFATNAPSLEMIEASLKEQDPAEHLGAALRNLAFVHYTNQPKPWQVDWSQAPKDALFDSRIWLKAFQSASGTPFTGDKTLTVRDVGRQVTVLRPASTLDEDFEYGMLYMEGSGGLGADPAEARWRLARPAAAGDAQAIFMIDRGLSEELSLPDKKKLTKIERCWALAGQRIAGNEDHQTLRAAYKMSEMEYLAKKAPGMVASCYWRINPEALAPRRMSPEELEAIFGSSAGQPATPALTPRLAKWLELVAKDNLEAASVMEAAAKQPPVHLQGWFVLPALGLVAAVVGALLWKMLNLDDGSRGSKKSKRKSKSS
jgi:hypothetical protein